MCSFFNVCFLDRKVPANQTAYNITGLVPGNLYRVEVYSSGNVNSSQLTKDIGTSEIIKVLSLI